jgi:hypothetical protein
MFGGSIGIYIATLRLSPIFSRVPVTAAGAARVVIGDVSGHGSLHFFLKR